MSESGFAVTAAGGLLVRGDQRNLEIALVHRPSYDDWSFPKGKADPEESARHTALREVREETGFDVHILGSAGRQEYQVDQGLKSVDYFLMRPIRSRLFRPNDEVDQLGWFRWEEAFDRLTYDLDRSLLDEVGVDGAATGGTVFLIRHGAAGNRASWEAPDNERPLTTKGTRQAKALAEELGGVGISRVLSSPFVRCIQTVQPLAARLGKPVETHPGLAEGVDRKAIAELLDEVAGTTVAMCSHGDVIPATLERLQRSGVRFLSPYECRKGSTWSIAHDGHAFTEAVYHAPSEA